MNIVAVDQPLPRFTDLLRPHARVRDTPAVAARRAQAAAADPWSCPERQHSYRFAHRVLRDRALEVPYRLLAAARDGREQAVLARMWAAAADETAPRRQRQAEGLGARTVGNGMLLVTLPEPLHPGEAYCALVAARPKRAVRYLLLERAPADPAVGGYHLRAVLTEWTPGGVHRHHHRLPADDTAFLGAVDALLDPAQK
ncbi:hypothetical protein NGB36_02855 [Streptomyces sp. RB6PN25]|uniref:Uncharacterized protein n=1 Tax=Streptomyces humicola TaxID=2953240 RepID=A0ABT1PSM8_9ACTN|nr:hypothetical protein [Streptomyces humicola]MCQ4079567.1 hypothetical protein [Streptomyces humicola]